jgi:hypothetical protein
MARAAAPSSPDSELSARRAWVGPVLAGGVLTEEIAAFCQSGVGIILAAALPGRMPVSARSLACRIGPDGGVRLVLHATPARPLLALLRAGAAIAATFSRPRDHRSIQLKAASAVQMPAEAPDLAAVGPQAAGFARELLNAGYPAGFVETFCAADLADAAVLGFVPTAAFVQTPGPGAGSPLEA